MKEYILVQIKFSNISNIAIEIVIKYKDNSASKIYSFDIQILEISIQFLILFYLHTVMLVHHKKLKLSKGQGTKSHFTSYIFWSKIALKRERTNYS